MKEVLGPQRVTSVVTLVDVVPGDERHLPAIIASTSVLLKSGGRKTVTEKVPVPDPALLSRLIGEVAKGDELQITVETDWSHPDLPTRLVAFSVVGAGVAPTAAR